MGDPVVRHGTLVRSITNTRTHVNRDHVHRLTSRVELSRGGSSHSLLRLSQRDPGSVGNSEQLQSPPMGLQARSLADPCQSLLAKTLRWRSRSTLALCRNTG